MLLEGYWWQSLNLTSQSKWHCHQHGVMLVVALSSWALKAWKSVNSAPSLSICVSPLLQKAQFSFFPEMFVLIQPLKFCTPRTTKTYLLEELNFTEHSAVKWWISHLLCLWFKHEKLSNLLCLNPPSSCTGCLVWLSCNITVVVLDTFVWISESLNIAYKEIIQRYLFHNRDVRV